MTDLVLTLRAASNKKGSLCDEAADEIERLRAEVSEVHAARIYLREQARLLREIHRLRTIAQSAHDRLLRGDSDEELCDLLETAWRGEV